MTDDPEHAERERPWLGMSDKQRRWAGRTGRTRACAKGDLELIDEVAGWPAPHIINLMELNRRLKDSIAGLTAEVKVARASSDRLSKILIRLTIFLIGLTVVLVGLTVALVILTIKLASGAH